jgi:hypothetical protein
MRVKKDRLNYFCFSLKMKAAGSCKTYVPVMASHHRELYSQYSSLWGDQIFCMYKKVL